MVKKKLKRNNPALSQKSAGLINFKDLMVAIIIFAIIGVFFYESTQFDEVSNLLGEKIKPGTFPQILIISIALMTFYFPFENYFLKKQGKDLDKDRKTPILKITWLSMLFLFIAVVFSSFLGIVLTMAFVCLGLPILWGEKNFYIITGYALGFPVLIYFIFQKLLGVYLEPGILSVILN